MRSTSFYIKVQTLPKIDYFYQVAPWVAVYFLGDKVWHLIFIHANQTGEFTLIYTQKSQLTHERASALTFWSCLMSEIKHDIYKKKKRKKKKLWINITEFYFLKNIIDIIALVLICWSNLHLLKLLLIISKIYLLEYKNMLSRLKMQQEAMSVFTYISECVIIYQTRLAYFLCWSHRLDASTSPCLWLVLPSFLHHWPLLQ